MSVCKFCVQFYDNQNRRGGSGDFANLLAQLCPLQNDFFLSKLFFVFGFSTELFRFAGLLVSALFSLSS
jgi:hypothetical protein